MLKPERIERNTGCRGRQKRSGPRGSPCCGPICERTMKGPNCSWESAEYAWYVNSYNISGMVSYTICSMISLRKVLKAFANSSFTKISSSVIFVTKLLEACIAASQPFGTATPTCNGAKKEPSLPRAYLLAHFAASLLSVYPITIGLRPPDFVESAAEHNLAHLFRTFSSQQDVDEVCARCQERR